MFASVHPSSHTVPHSPSCWNSIRQHPSSRQSAKRAAALPLGAGQPAPTGQFSQQTPTSSSWMQLCEPQPSNAHADKALSWPEHCTPSIQIWPSPPPKAAPYPAPPITARPPASSHPSARHTTRVLLSDHPSSQTEPHSPAFCTSTRPQPSRQSAKCMGARGGRLTTPSGQPWQHTPTSSSWPQLCWPHPR